MEPAVLGVVLDSSVVITAERKSLSVPQLVEAIQTAYGEIELSLSLVTGCSRNLPPSSQRTLR
jgi:hypothetical protein